MAQVSYSPLVPGTPENVNQINAVFAAFQAGINSVDSTQLANGAVTQAKLSSGVLTLLTPQRATQSNTSTQSTVGTGTFAQMGNMGTLTVPATGVYRISAFGSVFDAGASLLDFIVRVTINGAALYSFGAATISSGQRTTIGSFEYISLSAGDAVTLTIATNNVSAVIGDNRRWVLEVQQVAA